MKGNRHPRDFFYGEVLRLPPDTRDPDHYTLLGLKFFESDHDTILRAILERTELLETCRADPRPGYQAMLERLVATVREARTTLLDPARRAVYDAALIGHEPEEEAAPAEQDREVELRPGSMFADRYRIMGEARRGAFGVVYHALDKNLRTKVQMSVLRPSLSGDRTERRRIEKAAQVAASLDHPHIQRLDEVGDADGLLFVRLRDSDVRSVREATPLDAEKTRVFLIQAASALAYAHEKGVVHGYLRSPNVFLDTEGRALLTDFCVARAVRADDRPGPTVDLHAVGRLAYRLLADAPPEKKGVTLPEETPPALASVIHDLLGRNPPAAADVVERLQPSRPPRRRLGWLAAGAAVLLVAVAAAFLARSDPPAATDASVTEEAWRLIAAQRHDEAVRLLRDALAAEPERRALLPPLASALEGAAAKADPWTAQELLEEAQRLDPVKERESVVARARERAVAGLARVQVRLPAFAAQPVAEIDAAGVPLALARVGGVDAAPYAIELPEGEHEVAFELRDRAGNERAGTLPLVVDRTPPVVRIERPAPGARFRKGTIEVAVVVEEAHPPERVTIRGRPVALAAGRATTILRLEDGEHAIDVVVRDRAGHETRAGVTVLVDSRAPDLELAAARVVTRPGTVVVRGVASGRVARLSVDGRLVEPDAAGAFSAEVPAGKNRLVAIEAVGETGLSSKRSVEIVVDGEPPAVRALWNRLDRRGRLLYGSPEMDAGVFRLPLEVKDATAVTLHPAEGSIDGDSWRLEPREGSRRVQLLARDEAGNETPLILEVDGHRATPLLTVETTVSDYTREPEILIDVKADGDLFVQDKAAEPGRIRLPLSEGRHELIVVARDRFGNETRWRKIVHADRTPPTLTLDGEPERGIGLQEIVVRADEDIVTITCVGKTFDVNGRVARFPASLEHGRRRLTVVAKDLAGNRAETTFSVRIVNRVLVLDGKSAARAEIPQLAQGPFTIECWARGAWGSRRAYLLSGGRGVNPSVAWSSPDQSLPYGAVYFGNRGFVALPAKRAWRYEEWTHVALSWDGRRARFFVDGSLQHTIESDEPLRLAPAPFIIGGETAKRGGGVSGFFTGAIDEVRISSVARYTRAFRPARFHREDEATIALLRFDVMQGKAFRDSSGKGIRATPVGNPELVEEKR